MGEDTFKSTVFAFILVSLFAVLIISVVVDVGNSYGKDTTGVTGGLNFSGFNASISGIQSDAESLKASFEKQNVWSSIAGVVVEGIFGIALKMIGLIFLPLAIITGVMQNTLHIPAFVTWIIVGLVVFSVIFSIWRLIKIGD